MYYKIFMAFIKLKCLTMAKLNYYCMVHRSKATISTTGLLIVIFFPHCITYGNGKKLKMLAHLFISYVMQHCTTNVNKIITNMSIPLTILTYTMLSHILISVHLITQTDHVYT